MVCVYECNIVTVSIPVVYIVCLVWVNAPYVYSCDRQRGVVSTNIYVCPPF